ncbi:uncharacterized protein LOC134658089 [Cydia amplana]|uniref:uncharacterized protein LOC134658089 n=1 Tax=Cydia amplana TaxID=1869771 RepID=UPI002FE55163
MEEIMAALRNIQKDLEEQKIEIRKSGENVAELVTLNVNKILDEKKILWEENHEKLKEKVESQEKKIYFLEKQARQRNIVFFGIKEDETSYANLQDNITRFIKENFSVDLDHRDIQEVKRIGKKGERPRPLIVTFTTLGMKINIFKKKGVLKDTDYYLKEDYPQQVLEKRRELQEQVKVEQEKGNKVKIKYDKLVIIKPHNNKRSLPISPETNSQPQGDSNRQANKKNKSLNTHSTKQRSNSISDGVLKPSMLNFLVTKNTNNTTPNQDIENRDKNA